MGPLFSYHKRAVDLQLKDLFLKRLIYTRPRDTHFPKTVKLKTYNFTIDKVRLIMQKLAIAVSYEISQLITPDLLNSTLYRADDYLRLSWFCPTVSVYPGYSKILSREITFRDKQR